MNDLHLTERRPTLCKLAPDEAAFLRRSCRGVVEVLPTERRHVYRVTPGGVIGTLPTPRRRIHIAARLPAANLPWLLGLTGTRLPTGETGWNVFDLVADVLAVRLEERAAAGLHRGYREQPHQGPYLAGRLDVAAQVREPRREQLHCLHDAFTPQLPCNQVPATLARRLLAAVPTPGPRARLAEALRPWEAVADVPLSPGSLDDEPPPGYGGLYEACRWLLAAPSPGAEAPALLVSLDRVFERHVARIIARHAQCEAQRSHVVCPPGECHPGVIMRPDVTVTRGGVPVMAVDAKWKALPRDAVVTADLYQAVAYATALGLRQAMLVYPGRRRGWDLDVGSVRVSVVTLDVAGPIERCQRSGRRLGRLAAQR